jgi:hypothetical protein
VRRRAARLPTGPTSSGRRQYRTPARRQSRLLDVEQVLRLSRQDSQLGLRPTQHRIPCRKINCKRSSARAGTRCAPDSSDRHQHAGIRDLWHFSSYPTAQDCSSRAGERLLPDER